jgi:hypothetical protein
MELEAVMELEPFLAYRDTNLEAVLAAAEAAFGLNDAEILMAVGSLVEGLGSSKSDLDLLLVTGRDPSSLPPRQHVTFVSGRCLVDMLVLRLDDLNDLLDRFERWTQERWNVTHAVMFNIEDRTLLHRLTKGRHLLNAEAKSIERFPLIMDLARLKLHVARQAARTIQVDLAGYRDAGDPRSLVAAAQDLLGHAVDALLAANGVTNPLTKWRSRLIGGLPKEWEDPIGMQPTGESAADAFWRLHRAPERPELSSSIMFALEATTFARAVFLWAELETIPSARPRPLPRQWAGLRSGVVLPHLDFDVDFILAGDRAVLGRLNEFGGTLEVSPSELAVMLLFDGKSTSSAATAAIYGLDDPTPALELLDKVKDADLLAALHKHLAETN